MGAGVAVLGFAIGGLLAEQGFLSFFSQWLAQPALSLPDATSLPKLLGAGPMWLVVGTAFLIGLLLWFLPKPSPEPETWPWVQTGLILGALGTFVWVAGAPFGWHWGLSMTGPSRTLLGLLVDQASYPMTWGAYMLLGVPLGSWLSARSKGTARWQVPEAPELARRFCGGLLMGFGGTVAGGCNIGNALTGLSVLSLNSLVATVCILLGLALGVRAQELYR
ncbi:MAG: YeeE/YedE family protein [Deltaproteobacteria bacterium]|nr:YeeE/YedE family protein [Deltaproteobacteria bacterium]